MLARAALAALAVTAFAAADSSGKLSSMTMADVQALLHKHNLAPFLADSFEKYHIDGPTLEVLEPRDVTADAFPDAQPFHWSKFWAVLKDLRNDRPPSVKAEVHARQARLLAASNYSGFSGIHVNRDNAIVSLGASKDVHLRRSGEGELAVGGRLLVETRNYEVLDVADELVAGLNDTRLDSLLEMVAPLAEMVAHNADLIKNVTAACEALVPEPEMPIYTCIDSLNNGGGSGMYLTEDYGYVHCDNSLSVGGWTMAMNIDTSDGNVVSYNNKDFWEGTDTNGGASSNVNRALTGDYKNNAVFGSFPAGQLLVLVHEEGVVLGWRAFDMLDTTKPLSYYFQGGANKTNTCGDSLNDQTELGDGWVAVTAGSFDSDIGNLTSEEPMVYSDDCDLVANFDVGGTADYNRLSCAAHPDTYEAGNYGWGLGTLYDASYDNTGVATGIAKCPMDTWRPVCDAQLHATGSNWGTNGGVGGLIGTDNDCYGDCPWTTSSGLAYDYAIYVREATEVRYEDCAAALEDDAATGAYLLVSGEWAYCLNDISLGGWTLALNIDTSDGNVVDYSNYNFWESSTELGGAFQYPVRPFVHDYKNPSVFSSFPANEILVVLHEEGGEPLGYRAWTLSTPGQPLVEYFTEENACGLEGGSTLESNGFNYVTSKVIDSYVGDDIISGEPLIYNDDYQLYSNIETGESHDYNRLTAKDHPEVTATAGNWGWGLGTMYDATTDDTGSNLGYSPCPSTTKRPQCDAQFHAEGGNWGTSSGLGGMIGSDNNCYDDCPWTTASGYAWDYAIYVRASEPVYYDSCAAVAAASETSGQYLLSDNNYVYCFVDDSGAGWTLALNVATSDGNVVAYSNTEFWEGETSLGGATEHHATPFHQDYKNPFAFSEYEATAMLVVVHQQGVTTQAASLGWRSWNLAATQPLRDYFTGSNACGDGITEDDLSSTATPVTDGVTGGAVYDLNSMEPMVYNEYEVFANVENGNSHDYNRLAGKSSASDGSGNYGWGLGTMYDATHGNVDYICGPDGSTTARPQCDAQFHTIGGNWGTSSGTGGMIGTDNTCVSDCQWTTESEIYYDYAIFVQ